MRLDDLTAGESGRVTGFTPGNKPYRRKLLAMGLFGDFNSGKRLFDQGVNPGGVFATWMMVSLGAPFWLGVLEKLLGLRSLMSQKASDQRAWREQDQRSQAAGAPAGSESAAAAAAGSGK